jgi:hypothetical protein
LTTLRPLLCAGALALLAAGAFPIMPSRAAGASERPAPRIEARSATLLAVGIVHDDRMSVHLSRLIDNAPVSDAVLTVLLRGATHPATAEVDGSYTVQTKDLNLAGPASVIFQVAQGDTRENLEGALQITENQPPPKEQNSARQIGWWVLNFAVCIGFLLLLSRRRKAGAGD